MSRLWRSRIWIGLLLGLATPLAWADFSFFRVPSYVSLGVGGGQNQYQESALNLSLSFRGNWMLEAGFDRTATQASDGSDDRVLTHGYRFGAGSDPLRELSFRALAEGWELESVRARGGRVGATWAPGLWIFTLEYITQDLIFSNLPLLIQRDGEKTIRDTGFSLRVSTLGLRNWNIFIGGQGHSYDHDLSRLYEIPALILSRMPATALTTLTGLSRNDAYLGATYMWKRWDLGFEAGRSIAIVDNVKTRRLGLNGAFYPNRRWSFGLNLLGYRPEEAEESTEAASSATATVTFKW